MPRAAGARGRLPPFGGPTVVPLMRYAKCTPKMSFKMSLYFTEFVFRENVVPNSVKAV